VDHVLIAIGLKRQFKMHISWCSFLVVDLYLLGCDGMPVNDEISLTQRHFSQDPNSQHCCLLYIWH